MKSKHRQKIFKNSIIITTPGKRKIQYIADRPWGGGATSALTSHHQHHHHHPHSHPLHSTHLRQNLLQKCENYLISTPDNRYCRPTWMRRTASALTSPRHHQHHPHPHPPHPHHPSHPDHPPHSPHPPPHPHSRPHQHLHNHLHHHRDTWLHLDEAEAAVGEQVSLIFGGFPSLI